MLPKGGTLDRKAREIRSRALASDMGEDGGQKNAEATCFAATLGAPCARKRLT